MPQDQRRRRLAALSIVACAGVLSGCGEDQEAEKEPVIRPVLSMVVGDIERFRTGTYPGRARATQEVDIAFEVPGKLVERSADVGDEVERGDVLAKLDPEDFQNSLDAAIAERERSKAMLDRVEDAAKSGAVAQQEVTNARATFQAAEARVGIAQKALDDTLIIAPFDGAIATTYVENFENVLAKQPIMRLLDSSQIEMVVSVPEALIGLAPYVQDITVTFKALPDVKIPAKIKEVGTEASLTTRTYPVTIIMAQPEGGGIAAGMAGQATARVELPEDWAQQGVLIPASTVFSPNDAPENETFVWTVDTTSSTVARRAVEVVGTASHGVRVKGVEPGERVVTAGVSYLGEGQQVRLLED